jgi:OOP family OmpA-OmpF porin
MKKTTQVLLASGILGLSGGLSAQGIESSSGFGVELGGGYYMPDADFRLDDGAVGAVGLEYRLNEHWAINGWYLQTEGLDIKGIRDKDQNGDGEIRNANLNLTYYFTNSRWQPYVSAGGGQARYDYDGEDQDRSQFNLGLGLKFHMTPGFFLRGEVRGFSGEGETDGVALVSLGYLFGQHAKAAPVVDSDGDGVPDGSDQCPNTAAGVMVDSTGCPLDSDGDGVVDGSDQCPDTRAGSEVDANGCYLVLMETISQKLDVKAGFDSTEISAEGKAKIGKLADIMRKYPTATVLLEGHTDSSGPAEYNQKLSEERAAAVGSILSGDFGIDSSRIATAGYGESRPEADNSTAEGRAANRRIMVTMEAEVEKEMK